MTGTADERWRRYLQWNEALADVIYGPDVAGTPVYLDPEPEVLNAASIAAGDDAADPREALIDAVRPTLNQPTHAAGMFGGHIARLMRWLPESGEAPPVIGLLTVLCLAAEDMRESDGFAANNYYDRLMPLLGVSSDADKKRVVRAYRERSFDLWESLNTWLEGLHGERGLPTAYSYAHEHVGRPLSQALIRATDRSKLEDFFADAGLEPRSRVSPEDLEPLLNAWINRNPSPASHQIQALWKRSGARERILEIASQLLEGWEPPLDLRQEVAGTIATGRRSSLRLLALLRTFPSSVLELTLVGPDVGGATAARLVDTNDGGDLSVEIALDRLPDGRWRLLDGEMFEAQALIEGAIGFEFPSDETLTRRPRRVVPLKKDDLLQAFVEVERLHLGEDGMVLCTSGLASLVEDALAQIARPGFRRFDPPPPGCPPDWALFTHIQVLTPLVSTKASSGQDWPLDLNVLQPLSSSQLVVQGGLQLPGRIRRWSSRAAPEIRAAADNVDAIRLTIERVGTFQDRVEVFEEEVAEPVLLVDLQTVGLADGDYDIVAMGVSNSKSRTLNNSRLRLRSADSPNPVPTGRPALAWLPDGVAAGPWDEAHAAIRGSEVVGNGDARVWARSPVGVPGWWTRRQDPELRLPPQVAQERVSVARDVRTDCFQTGAHVLQLPTYYGKASSKTVEGVCKHCGLVKRFPGSYYRLRRQSKPKQRAMPQAPIFDVLSAPSVLDGAGVTPDIAFDALAHDGAGPAAWIEQVALQVEPSQLFVDRFVRALDVLAHIEVEREPSTLTMTSWEVLPPALVETPENGFVLTGRRSRRLEQALNEAAEALAIVVDKSPQRPVAPDRITAKTDRAGATALAQRAGALADVQIRVVVDAARGIAGALPSLRAVIDGLPRRPLVGARLIRRWSTDVARWRAVGDASAPGAYQLRSPAPVYCIRDESDVANGTMRRVDARLAKYIACFDAGEQLVGYDTDTSTLYVPLGAELPGLYGRAAALCSGRLPLEDEAQRVTRYPSVPLDVAEHLASLLLPEPA